MIKSTITRERLEQLANFKGAPVTRQEEQELARMALAAMDSEPVAIIDQANLGYLRSGADADVWPPEREEMGDVLLYRHAQPAVDSEFIPKNLDKALGVLGMAIPESREEFNFQTERWIQRLIDRVIRYADEFQEQPASVVPDVMEPTIEAIKRILPTSNPDEYAACIGADMWNACRAAMLAAAPQEVKGE